MTIIQITKSGTVFSGNSKDLECLHTEFEKTHCIKLSKFLEPKLLHLIQSQISLAEFYEVNYPASGQDNPMYRIKDKTSEGILRFLVNDKKLFQLIEQITGCSKIGSFTGRVCCMSPNLGHRDAWHNDLVDNRMIAMSINLSTEVYSGGTLQILDTRSKHIVHEVANTGFGDGIIFRIAPYLNHRLTEVTGKTSRTFFAGWFRLEPVYKPIFKPLLEKKNPVLKNRPKIPRYSTVTRASNLYFRNSNNQLLVFNPTNSTCFGIDPIGASVLDMLKEPMTVTKIRNAILNTYDVETDKCEQDLLTLLKELETNEIIDISPMPILKGVAS